MRDLQLIDPEAVRVLLRDVACGVVTLRAAEDLVDELAAPPPVVAPAELPGQIVALCPQGRVAL